MIFLTDGSQFLQATCDRSTAVKNKMTPSLKDVPPTSICRATNSLILCEYSHHTVSPYDIMLPLLVCVFARVGTHLPNKQWLHYYTDNKNNNTTRQL